MVFKQANRSVHLTTPLGEDGIQLTGFSGEEELSRLFRFSLSLVSMNPAIAPEELVGKNITFSIEYDDGERRYFNGFVNRFSAGDEDFKGRRSYAAEVVPWLWFLTQTTDCRIFQDQSVIEIIESVFQDLGFADFEFACAENHPKREYCVQYRETDFAFVSRLLEEEGVFYYFSHENGKHKLVMSDNKNGYGDCKESSVDYPMVDEATRHIKPHIRSWEHSWQFRTGAWAHTDYNFKTPSQNLLTAEKTMMKFQDVKKYEDYDYPGEYPDKGIGAPLARVRMEELELSHDLVNASSGCSSFSPGLRFKLGRHRAKSEAGKSFIIRKILHEANEDNYETGDGGGGFDYTNHFECFPDSTTFRPARLTPRPFVRGTQTAVVTGPAGEEIHTDEYGRVKVQFHWDRYGKYDDQSSCWIRCAQNIAGKRWGFMAIPRIGQEAVVDFLEGDPDQPMIVGVVYNAEQMPHYALPAEKTKSYYKSNSSKGGDGHNEIRFEDKMDQEQIYLHAERNMDVRVKNDSMELVINDRHLIVGSEKDGKKVGNQRELVYQDKHLHVKRDHAEHIEGWMELAVGFGGLEKSGYLDVSIETGMWEYIGKEGFHLTVEGCRNVKIGGGDSTSVGGNSASSISGNRSAKIKGDDKTKMDGSLSLDIGGDYQEKTGMKHAVEAGMEVHIKAGMKVIIEAGVQLSLVGPGGFIDIGPAGVFIQGTMVMINSGGAAGSGSGSSPAAPDDPAAPEPTTIDGTVAPTIADNSTSGRKSCKD